MGIDSKHACRFGYLKSEQWQTVRMEALAREHAYRFVYLKSEQWQTVRIEALAREKGCCQICKEFSASNDAHHVEYPESVWNTKQDNLVILCRGCHDLIHALLDAHELKTHTKLQFYKICTAMIKWKMARQEWANETVVKPPDKKLKHLGMDRCFKCQRVVSRLIDYKFFSPIGGPSKYRKRLCDDCVENAKEFLENYPDKDAKNYTIYDAWKKTPPPYKAKPSC